MAAIMRPALALAAVFAAALALLLTLHHFHADDIRANRQAHETAQMSAALAGVLHDTRLPPAALPLTVMLPQTRLVALYPVRRDGALVAALLQLRAQAGYNGAIDLLLAQQRGGGRPALRVLQHRETAGIADFLTKQQAVAAYDGVSGATISAAAVSGSVDEATAWLQRCMDWTAGNDDAVVRAGC